MYRLLMHFSGDSHSTHYFKENEKEEFERIYNAFLSGDKRIEINNDGSKLIVNTDNVTEVYFSEEESK